MDHPSSRLAQRQARDGKGEHRTHAFVAGNYGTPAISVHVRAGTDKSSKRDDVALALRYLVDRPDAAGLAIDMVGGKEPIESGLDAFIKKGETDFLG